MSAEWICRVVKLPEHEFRKRIDEICDWLTALESEGTVTALHQVRASERMLWLFARVELKTYICDTTKQ